MNLSEKYLITLEFDKILELLKESSSLEASEEKILSLRPSNDYESVKRMQKETSSAKKVIMKKGAPNFSCHKTIPDIISRAKKGAVLNPLELLRTAGLLRCCNQVKKHLEILDEDDKFLAEIVKRLILNDSIEKEINKCIESEDTVSDDASPELYNIRRKKNHSASKIRDVLQHYISGAYSNYLQENIITFRNSRFVIPVKSEYKNEIKGLVHDTSASGATVFIEPMSVVELNNEIKILESEERNEVERILKILSSKIVAFSDELILDYYNIVEISVIFAKAELSCRMNAIEPDISFKGQTELIKCRHPLIPEKEAVPISLTLGKNYDTLIITGPNTGGKTVTLKTCGLVSAMAQSGLHIPAESAVLPVYDDIFADIGDEQSIEQSLSTFSSHMVNIIEMVKYSRKNTLVLFDELGSGTDPVEGAALAESILEKVRENGAKCIATTHYPELKNYALETEKVENASCEFDVTTLKPTYRLIIGTPGRSNAFLISEKLGMPKEIIDRAGILIKSENRNFEKIVSKLEADRIKLEKELSLAEKDRAEAEKMRDEALKERKSILDAAEKELDRAKREATRLIMTTRQMSDKTFDELDKLRRDFEKKKNLEMLEKGREYIRKNLSDAEKDSEIGTVSDLYDDDGYILPRPLKVGDNVFVTNIEKEGTVEKIGKEIVVAVGNMRMKTSEKYLRLITKKKPDKSNQGSVFSSRRNMVTSSVDVRGYNTEDAWSIIDKYFDDAVLCGLKNVTVIHGKGTGQLKKGLVSYFKKDPRIKNFRQGLWGEGDGGVTVIELK